MLRCDHFTNRTNQMTIGRELSLGIKLFELSHGAIDVSDRSGKLYALLRHFLVYRGGGGGGVVVGFHSRASFCASAICSGVMAFSYCALRNSGPRQPCVADTLYHM